MPSAPSPSLSPSAPAAKPLPWRAAPIDLLRAWPTERPLASIVAGGKPGRWSRWSIFAAPTEQRPPTTADPLSELERLLIPIPDAPRAHADDPAAELPFHGGWIGWLSYDLGRSIEPTAQSHASSPSPSDRSQPLFHLCRCPGAYVHDALTHEWWAVGDRAALPRLEDPSESAPLPARASGWSVSCLESQTGHASFVRAVRDALDLIAAGDVFQVNLAHRLTGAFDGAPRALAADLLSSAAPWFGAWIERGDAATGLRSAILSLSPELFLDIDLNTRRVITRPIKGTRPASSSPAELLASEKDRAELTMIVDLMRNDLGRVCEYGTVRVDSPSDIERHAGVIHSVATISGQLRESVSHADLLRATFPPGSITGAPKIRAMQIIDELEPVRRGPYCGAVGFISDHGRACWNVAIRTAALSFDAGSTTTRATGVLDYSVGAGIVADSDPESEWEETLTKSHALRSVQAP